MLWYCTVLHSLLILSVQEDTEPTETDSQYFHFLQSPGSAGADMRLGDIKLEPGAEEGPGDPGTDNEKDRIKKDNHNKSKRN